MDAPDTDRQLRRREVEARRDYIAQFGIEARRRADEVAKRLYEYWTKKTA